ncbi:22988_t:CDS:2 [Gigaspora margarita]|uniref:22988_t:CDS:1 n=1 Tax=Gigaspora margarita TaxID=4874 RepID=A0ABN7V001_GIGMA|nr:22988_t:CDS:2 [Gigaspora margarita]
MSKQTAVSKWHSVLSMLFKVYEDNPKFADIYQNYKKNEYEQAIEDYFKSSSASILDEEKLVKSNNPMPGLNKRANSEGTSSKSRCRNNKENSRGKKPDFKLLVNTNDEILFGKVKLPKYKNSSSLVYQDFVKLADFQSGALDKLVKKYGNRIGMTSFGVWICGKCTGLVVQDVPGRRRSSTHSKIPIHKSSADIGGIVQYKILEIIISDTSLILSRSDYCRLPLPEPIQVTVLASNER